VSSSSVGSGNASSHVPRGRKQRRKTTARSQRLLGTCDYRPAGRPRVRTRTPRPPTNPQPPTKPNPPSPPPWEVSPSGEDACRAAAQSGTARGRSCGNHLNGCGGVACRDGGFEEDVDPGWGGSCGCRGGCRGDDGSSAGWAAGEAGIGNDGPGWDDSGCATECRNHQDVLLTGPAPGGHDDHHGASGI
jgi:hypothetical protein